MASSIRLESDRTAPARARSFVGRLCSGDPDGGRLRVAVSDLVTGVICCDDAPAAIEVAVARRPGATRIEVGPCPDPPPESTGIVEALGGRWGVCGTGDERALWCEFGAPEQGGAGR